jgi:Na+-transporting methylmalonyl-CoA/oxaloacetate decarboxylase gamma subunit
MADGNGLGGNSNQGGWSQMPGSGEGKEDKVYPSGTNEASFILSPSGMAIVAILVTSVAVVVYMISHKIIRREDQITKYVDTWEGSEKKQREALDYISKANKKKTAQNTLVDSDSAEN